MRLVYSIVFCSVDWRTLAVVAAAVAVCRMSTQCQMAARFATTTTVTLTQGAQTARLSFSSIRQIHRKKLKTQSHPTKLVE
jgi:hypothetical protein